MAVYCVGRRYLNMTMWSRAHTVHCSPSASLTLYRGGGLFADIAIFAQRCKILTRGVNRERAESMRYGPGIERGKNIVLLTRYIRAVQQAE